MIQQRTKLKARRIFRSRKRLVGDFADTASRGADKHIFRRIQNFGEVARFSIAWVSLIIVLIGSVSFQTRSLERYYLSYQPAAGGIYTEGMVGTFTNANPLFSSSSVDLSASRLVFSSILTYNYEGKLVNDLAESVTKDESGLVYTVTLKQNIRWHDGEPFTSADVVYTYQVIQNPDTRSPYNLSWQGVTIEALGPSTVKFTLPTPLNSFQLSLTNGIVPKHVLSTITPAQLRSSDFNAQPIGTGPFKWNSIDRTDDMNSNAKKQRIEFLAYSGYFKKKPDLNAFVMQTFADEAELSDALQARAIDGGVYSDYPEQIFDKETKYQLTTSTLLGGTYLFMNNAQSTLTSIDLRQALVLGTDTQGILASLPYPVRRVTSPLLSTHIGYDTSIEQFGYDVAAANTKLDTLGWLRQGSDIRMKDGKQLELTLTTIQDSDLAIIAGKLQAQWSKDLGVKLVISLKTPQKNQEAILQHSYDILLYGISIGSDPDVYAYWHSSQASSEHFNLSNYKSEAADAALEAGRTRPDEAVRAAKYKQFLTAWRNDAPAIGLYQPVTFYVTTNKLFGYTPRTVNGVADRFYEVQDWRFQVTKQPILK